MTEPIEGALFSVSGDLLTLTSITVIRVTLVIHKVDMYSKNNLLKIKVKFGVTETKARKK